MSKEAMKLALEAMTYADACLKKQLTTKDKHQYAQDLLLEAGTAIREALAEQPAQQEPFGYFRYDLRLDAWVQNRAGLTGTPFYTSPPASKPWVGLTDEERMDVLLALNWDKQLTHMDTAKSIETKLREKNHG